MILTCLPHSKVHCAYLMVLHAELSQGKKENAWIKRKKKKRSLELRPFTSDVPAVSPRSWFFKNIVLFLEDQESQSHVPTQGSTHQA